MKSIQRDQEEIARLRILEQDVRWGKIEMAADKQDRLRQYLAGRSEIVAGDQLVLENLGKTARETQRLMLGLPLVLLGAAGLCLLSKRTSRFALFVALATSVIRLK